MSDRDFAHISEAIASFLKELRVEAEEGIERLGGFRGPVLPPQRPWSRILDRLEDHAEEQPV